MFRWLNHLQEELMDAVLYLQKAKEVYTEDLQDDLCVGLMKLQM